jgi:2-iminoacetate synthase ThiH
MQGGIHPEFDGKTYLSLLRAVKQSAPAIQELPRSMLN